MELHSRDTLRHWLLLAEFVLFICVQHNWKFAWWYERKLASLNRSIDALCQPHVHFQIVVELSRLLSRLTSAQVSWKFTLTSSCHHCLIGSAILRLFEVERLEIVCDMVFHWAYMCELGMKCLSRHFGPVQCAAQSWVSPTFDATEFRGSNPVFWPGRLVQISCWGLPDVCCAKTVEVLWPPLIYQTVALGPSLACRAQDPGFWPLSLIIATSNLWSAVLLRLLWSASRDSLLDKRVTKQGAFLAQMGFPVKWERSVPSAFYYPPLSSLHV